MPQSTLQITHEDQRLSFPQDALGGTPKSPLLKPGDELLLNWLAEQNSPNPVAIYHDRFGTLCTCARAQNPYLVSDDWQHAERLRQSFERNNLGDPLAYFAPLAKSEAAAVILMNVPKSVDLFEQYLRHAVTNAAPGAAIAAAFQTKYFTPRMLEVAAEYAGEVNQSRAYKKARLLLLNDLKSPAKSAQDLLETEFHGITYRQYPGVFSAGHIDYATQFLLDEWVTSDALAELPPPAQILDGGCGNGIIGDWLLQRYPEARLTAYDVSALAVASTKINLEDHQLSDRATVLQASNMQAIKAPEKFDLIVTNPPFHDGHRTNINVSLDFFRSASDRLTPSGNLVVVANKHLNYLTHLRRSFDEVMTVAENEKFIIYRAS